jgi:hypothetical protein
MAMMNAVTRRGYPPLTSCGVGIRLRAMGMHLEPDPSGKPEFNDNELIEQDLDRHVREAEREHLAEGETVSKPSFWRRLFRGKRTSR